jgi:hypothetical protein
VEKIIYRDGKEPPTIVEKEVVRWVDRIVLIPRWGLKYPVHANSLARDDNVSQIIASSICEGSVVVSPRRAVMIDPPCMIERRRFPPSWSL